MTQLTFWFVLASVLVGLELFTGTFYLLVFGAAAGAAGFTAFYGYPLAAQGVVAAVFALFGVTWLRRRPATSKPADDNLDLGQRVTVSTWRDDGTARVSYRGAEWDAHLLEGEPGQPQHCVIHEIRGNTLILSAQK
ncbi:NfeD family protein [Sulfuriferula sp.]|uniref:NfeD family protein n=1 Tax=Sulfuriferula sp. TaxID=2025307 RepID=UPI002730D055|nr:NfeD family protein [Sulfuriferula sp.]MDP2026842.1 NfeD family protein [Sulfuriferula sp.]